MNTTFAKQKLGVQDVPSRQSIRGGHTAGNDTNKCTRIFKRRQARPVCRGISTGGTHGDTLHCSEPLANVRNTAHRWAHAYFHAKAQRLVLVRLPAEDQRKNDAGETRPLSRCMYGTCDAASNWECDWQNHLKQWSYKLEQSSKDLSHDHNKKMSRMTRGDDFVFTGSTPKLIEPETTLAGVYPIRTNIISHGSTESIKALSTRVRWVTKGMENRYPRRVDCLAKKTVSNCEHCADTRSRRHFE